MLYMSKNIANNLIPPFVMCEAGLVLSDTPKKLARKKTTDDHYIISHDKQLHIPLTLRGVFFYFLTTRSTEE